MEQPKASEAHIPEYDAAIAKIADASSPDEAVSIIRRLVGSADDHLLGRMRCLPDDAIALQSAWESVRQSLPSVMADEASPADAVELARFLGFIEGRFRVVVPTTWSTGFRSAKGYSQDHVFFKTTEQLSYVILDSGTCVHGAAEAREVGGSLQISHDRGNVTVPARIRSRNLSFWPYVSVASDSETCYVATHGQRSAPFSLHAIDVETNKVVWSSQVWAAGTARVYSGMGWHQVEVLVQDGRVIVFGLADGIAYIEAFRSADGENICRFSTDY